MDFILTCTIVSAAVFYLAYRFFPKRQKAPMVAIPTGQQPQQQGCDGCVLMKHGIGCSKDEGEKQGWSV